jgi:hypothetical protein
LLSRLDLPGRSFSVNSKNSLRRCSPLTSHEGTLVQAFTK